MTETLIIQKYPDLHITNSRQTLAYLTAARRA